jgi:hypothetical protein
MPAISDQPSRGSRDTAPHCTVLAVAKSIWPLNMAELPPGCGRRSAGRESWRPSETAEAGSAMTEANFEAKIDVVVVVASTADASGSPRGAVFATQELLLGPLSHRRSPTLYLIDVHDEVTRSSLSSSECLDEAARAGRIKDPKASCGAHGGRRPAWRGQKFKCREHAKGWVTASRFHGEGEALVESGRSGGGVVEEAVMDREPAVSRRTVGTEGCVLG